MQLPPSSEQRARCDAPRHWSSYHPAQAKGVPHVNLFRRSAAPLLLACSVSAQVFQFSLQLDPINSYYGVRVVPAGDFDQDGARDFACIEFGYELSPSQLQVLRLLSGNDGHQLAAFTRPTTVAWKFRDIAAAGDLTGDGVPDLVLATDMAVEVRSGVDLSNVRAIGAGGSPRIFVAGDIDQDGIDDVGIRTPANIEIRSGATGAFIRSVPGYRGAAIGDVNGDLVPDIITDDAGTWAVGSGATGQLLWSLPMGSSINRNFAAIGDANLDGIPDVALSDYFVCQGGSCTGTVRILSGLNGSVLQTTTHPDPHSYFGAEISASGPMDASGRSGFLASDHGSFSPAVLRGVTASGSDLFTLTAPSIYNLIGGFDLTGDGASDFAFGTFGPTGATFSFDVYSTVKASFQTFGAGCGLPGSIPSILCTSLPRIGQSFSLQVTNLTPVQLGFVYTGFSAETWTSTGISLPLDLTPIGLAACSVLISPDIADVSWSGNGIANWSFMVPSAAAFYGFEFYNQAIFFSSLAPGGLVLSNAGHARIGS